MSPKITKSITYPVGSLVKIKKHKSKPPNWNPEMMKMAGLTLAVRAAHPGAARDYRYRLEGYRWSWRHTDLELTKMPKPEPNRAFRNKKNGH